MGAKNSAVKEKFDIFRKYFPRDAEVHPNGRVFPFYAAIPLLESDKINTEVTPVSSGGPDAAERQGGNNLTHIGDPAFDTADFGEENSGGPGNLRVDYVLPSRKLRPAGGGVYWPRAAGSVPIVEGAAPAIANSIKRIIPFSIEPQIFTFEHWTLPFRSPIFAAKSDFLIRNEVRHWRLNHDQSHTHRYRCQCDSPSE